MNGHRHRSWREIIDWLEKASEDGSPQDKQFEACSECESRVEEARRFLSRLGHARFATPPAHLLELAWERVRREVEAKDAASLVQRDSTMERVRQGLRELWATLTADSLQPSLAVRGAATAASPRMVRYETEEFAISISLSEDPASGTKSVRGQVVPLHESGLPPDGRFRLTGEGEEREALIDEFGEFEISGLARAVCQATIQLGGMLIRFELPA